MEEKKGKYEIPREGSLGLLALGYSGVMAWRKARRAMNQQLKKKKKNEG